MLWIRTPRRPLNSSTFLGSKHRMQKVWRNRPTESTTIRLMYFGSKSEWSSVYHLMYVWNFISVLNITALWNLDNASDGERVVIPYPPFENFLINIKQQNNHPICVTKGKFLCSCLIIYWRKDKLTVWGWRNQRKRLNCEKQAMPIGLYLLVWCDW